MIERILQEVIQQNDWGRQMRFIVGPRQTGKTTLAKAVLAKQHSQSLYYNWDDPEVVKRYRQDAHFLAQDLSGLKQGMFPWAAFDEIHKYPHWKNALKGMFDTFESRVRFLVTGSAKLDLLRHSGDSMAGRYFVFHLNPLQLCEMVRSDPRIKMPWPAILSSAQKYLEAVLSWESFHQSLLCDLLDRGGFPEPFLKGDSLPFQKKWHRDYLDHLVREDLRDLTRIQNLEHTLELVQRLSGHVGSLISVSSLQRDLQTSYNAVKNSLRALQMTYVIFELTPYTRKISRGLKKAPKIYLYDWTFVKDEAARFENYVAAQLLAKVQHWTDAGWGEYDLKYVRQRDGRESDFLILKDGRPWLLLEAKLKDQSVASHHRDQARALGDIPVAQIVREDRVARQDQVGTFRISASRFFAI